ncbi:hypothetical protein LOCC1_G008572 [Lachnellula occidentalis]|uniref:Ribosomal protein n=1 Tax=Lachnellula occidentalis TaxID=215460 RepID=A0A8H8RBE2_9HELO|nr:hypothetical protein LOCC1_G008572 [Lachnellula occidentalis]
MVKGGMASEMGGIVQQQVRGMKVRSSVKKMCEGCKSVRRKGREEGERACLYYLLVESEA